MTTALAEVAAGRPDVLIVFPVHRNPLVRESVVPTLLPLENVVLTEPLPYGEFVHLMSQAHLILTDSGGIQEEGPSLGKPVLVLRDVTERPEAVAAGTVRLVGTNPVRLVTEVHRLLDDPDAYQAMANAVNPYGDGRAVPRAVAALGHFFGQGARPEEFVSHPAADELFLFGPDRSAWKETSHVHELAIPPSVEDLDGDQRIGAGAAVGLARLGGAPAEASGPG
jgi:UDP-N-acetylglucosamine 2-epimerase (non-hydrolysing)